MDARIYIVDDEMPARSRLKTLLGDIAATCPTVVVGEADHAEAALAGIRQLSPDIVLLDVQMPGTTGVELAAELKHLGDSAPSVIFVTAYDDYALKAFEVQALDYLMKPVRAQRLEQAIARALQLRSATPRATVQAVRRHFTVQVRGKMLMVPVADVRYLKAEQKYVTLRTPQAEYLIEESLNTIEQEFGDQFVRIHRNALVARDAIAGVEKGGVAIDAVDAERHQDSWQVIVRDVSERLPISRRQWASIKALVK